MDVHARRRASPPPSSQTCAPAALRGAQELDTGRFDSGATRNWSNTSLIQLYVKYVQRHATRASDRACTDSPASEQAEGSSLTYRRTLVPALVPARRRVRLLLPLPPAAAPASPGQSVHRPSRGRTHLRVWSQQGRGSQHDRGACEVRALVGTATVRSTYVSGQTFENGAEINGGCSRNSGSVHRRS